MPTSVNDILAQQLQVIMAKIDFTHVILGLATVASGAVALYTAFKCVQLIIDIIYFNRIWKNKNDSIREREFQNHLDRERGDRYDFRRDRKLAARTMK
jgi:hypothetical protein